MGHSAYSVVVTHGVYGTSLWWYWGSINLSSIVSLYPHQTAQAQHQLSSLSIVNTPLLVCHRQCQWTPGSIAPNFQAERSSPLTAGDLNISNYTILNTFKLLARRIWLFAARPDALNPLSIMNSTLTKIQSITWTSFPTSNSLNTSQTRGLNHCHLLCRSRKHTPVPVLCWEITSLSHGNAMLRVSLRRTYKTIPTICLRRMKSTNISSVRSRRRAWRRTMTMCWRKKTPLCDSQASKMRMASRSLWLTCQLIWLLGSGNFTLSRIRNGITITTPYQRLESRDRQKNETVDEAANVHRESHLRPSASL